MADDEWMKWKDIPTGENANLWARKLRMALDEDCRPGYLVALLSAYLGARGGDSHQAKRKPEADLFFGCGGAMTTINEKIDKYEQKYKAAEKQEG